MKKILLFITAFFIAHRTANAQTEKGDQAVGFYLNYSYSKDNHFVIIPTNNLTATVATTLKSFSIGPQYSYFIADKLEAGFYFGYSSYNNQYISDNSNYQYNPNVESGKNHITGVFIRKYMMLLDKVGLRAQPFLEYQWGSSQDSYPPSTVVDNNTVHSQQYIAGANFDLVFYPTKKFGITGRILNFDYYHYTATGTSQGRDSQDGINLGFISDNLYLSVFYVFGQ